MTVQEDVGPDMNKHQISAATAAMTVLSSLRALRRMVQNSPARIWWTGVPPSVPDTASDVSSLSWIQSTIRWKERHVYATAYVTVRDAEVSWARLSKPSDDIAISGIDKHMSELALANIDEI